MMLDVSAVKACEDCMQWHLDAKQLKVSSDV